MIQTRVNRRYEYLILKICQPLLHSVEDRLRFGQSCEHNFPRQTDARTAGRGPDALDLADTRRNSPPVDAWP